MKQQLSIELLQQIPLLPPTDLELERLTDEETYAHEELDEVQRILRLQRKTRFGEFVPFPFPFDFYFSALGTMHIFKARG